MLESIIEFLKQSVGILSAFVGVVSLWLIAYIYQPFLLDFIKKYSVLFIWSIVFFFAISFFVQYIVFFFYTVNSAIAVSFSPIIASSTMTAISSIIFAFFVFIILRILYPIISNLNK